MKPLLKVQTVPINLEYKIQRAQLKQNTEQPRVNVTRSRGNAYIQTTPAQVKIDTYEARASAGLKSAPRAVREFADAGKSAAMEATRNYAEQGNQITDSHGKGQPMLDVIQSKAIRTADTIMAFIPSVPPEITVQDGSISFDFTMDKLSFDWNINTRAQFDYIPGEIEFTITEYPRIIIEYVGGPIYVPPSADPDYDPEFDPTPDMEASA